MQKQYYINLEKYSLKQLKKSLQKRDMIPSRVILKEKIEERFGILTAQGIKNTKALIDALKTKKKIEIFSKKTGLPVDYLTILKREASSYLPNPIRLDKFPGVNSEDITSLEAAGIKNTKQLYNKVQTCEGKKKLLKQTGIPEKRLDNLISLSDLARLYGVGPVFAKLIFDVGIVSAKDFARHTAEEFIAIYEKKTKKKADFGVNDVNFSIEMAKELMRS
jgi:nucleotidyltransferase/DNA polymerase involved in DNA repair